MLKINFNLYDTKYLYNKFILRFLHIVKKILLGNLIADAPKNSIKSIIESHGLVASSIEKIIKIRNCVIEQYNYPNDYPIYFLRKKAFEERFMYILKDVYLSIDTGLIWTQDKKIFQESFGSFKKMYVKNDIRPYINLPYYKIFNQAHVYFLPCTGFYHFLLEEIPALLYALEKFKDLKIIVPQKKLPRYYFEILRSILGSESKKRLLFSSKNLFLNRIVMVQKTDHSGFVYSKDIALINKYVLYEKTNLKSRKIYISRKFAYKRPIANEIELEEALRSLKFKIIYLEKISFQDQIKEVTSAKVIASPHGAGLSHIIWGNRKKQLIEIFPSRENHGYKQCNDCYANIASLKGLKYNYVICKNQKGLDIAPIKEILDLLKSDHLPIS